MTDNENENETEVHYADGTTGYLPRNREPWAAFGTEEYYQQIAGDNPKLQALMRGFTEEYQRFTSSPDFQA